jgi:hypothetical protein
VVKNLHGAKHRKDAIRGNKFRSEVIERIDEGLFIPLFHHNFGAPNASIRVLISMMILKEANGWSDSQLFSQCQFNILVRSALGLFNLDDAVPSDSTYYLLRKKIVEWERAETIDTGEFRIGCYTRR